MTLGKNHSKFEEVLQSPLRQLVQQEIQRNRLPRIEWHRQDQLRAALNQFVEFLYQVACELQNADEPKQTLKLELCDQLKLRRKQLTKSLPCVVELRWCNDRVGSKPRPKHSDQKLQCE